MKILQIAYHYPPMGGAGVQRALKFSKYLPLEGITPVVLAGLDPHYVQDASLLADVPSGLEVHRVPFSPWLARLAARRRAQAGAARPAGAAAHAAAAHVAAAHVAQQRVALGGGPPARRGRDRGTPGRGPGPQQRHPRQPRRRRRHGQRAAAAAEHEVDG